MDVLYEESAVNKNAAKSEKKYKIITVCSWAVVVLAAVCLMLLIPNLVASFNKSAPPEGISAEDWANSIAGARGMAIFFAMPLVSLVLLWVFLYWWRKRVNVSYDYTFVSGELRIAKVFNVNRRKFLYKIQPEEILQIGDVENAGYDRLRSDPSTRQVLLTPNDEPAEGKFFMYILIGGNAGKKLCILECREELLVNILRFVKRGTLESDYVSQEKKKRN